MRMWALTMQGWPEFVRSVISAGGFDTLALQLFSAVGADEPAQLDISLVKAQEDRSMHEREIEREKQKRKRKRKEKTKALIAQQAGPTRRQPNKRLSGYGTAGCN